MFGEERPLEVLSHSEAIGLIEDARVGRVVFTVAALPAIVPVAFAVLDDAIVMRTSETTRLAGAADGGVLAFEVDDIDPVAREGWSVVVTGVAEVVSDPAVREAIYRAVEPFAAGDNAVCVRLPMTLVNGRRKGARPADVEQATTPVNA